MSEELLQLRKQIDEIDKSLLRLLAKRMQLVTAVSEVKSQQGLPIYMPDREASMLEARCKEAKKIGIAPDLIKDILRRIMHESYLYENNQGFKKLNADLGPIIIVGGQGQMGKLFSRLFRLSGYEVYSLSEEDWNRADELLANAAVVMVSVPIHLTLEVINRLPKLPEDTLLMDICSIKESPLKAMLSVHNGAVVGLHPMFGSDVNSIAKQVIIYCEGRNPQAYQWLLKQLNLWGAKLYKINAIEHDKYMRFIQVLRHFTTFAYGEYLSEQKIDLQQLLTFSSPIYQLELVMVGRLFAQDPQLYADIIMATDENIDLIVKFCQSFSHSVALLKAYDKKNFIAQFKKISQWFGQDAKRFMRESNTLLQQANDISR
ncbi:MAG: bifunctional chorismate mutase/prephenate dehydrogenase [Arsenophonus sp. NC-WZS1-MAG3]